MDKVEKKLGLKKGSPKVNELKKSLIQAGIYSKKAPSIYFGLKLGLSVALPVLVLPWLFGRGISTFLLLVIFFGLVALGYFLPTLVLGHMVESRQKKIKEGLPDALDLMVVCVEAGQGLNAAMKRVSDDLQLSNPILAREMSLVNLEISAGLEREVALRNLAERTGVEDVASLTSMLIQADRFGTFGPVPQGPIRDLADHSPAKIGGTGRQDPGKAGFSPLIVHFSRPHGGDHRPRHHPHHGKPEITGLSGK